MRHVHIRSPSGKFCHLRYLRWLAKRKRSIRPVQLGWLRKKPSTASLLLPLSKLPSKVLALVMHQWDLYSWQVSRKSFSLNWTKGCLPCTPLAFLSDLLKWRSWCCSLGLWQGWTARPDSPASIGSAATLGLRSALACPQQWFEAARSNLVCFVTLSYRKRCKYSQVGYSH